MAIKNYLRKDELDVLRDNMLHDGWVEHPPCGEYEVMRMWRNKQWVLIHRSARDDEYLSITHNDYPLIRHYLGRR